MDSLAPSKINNIQLEMSMAKNNMKSVENEIDYDVLI